ncbi:MAG: translation elongation factor Ts [Acholeplasmataceae bacterium]
MDQKLLKQLRNETGASFLLCKQALESSNDQYEAAIKYINQHQIKEKGNDRVASKGIVVVENNDLDAILFEINGETDFLVKNPYFINAVNQIKDVLLNSDVINAKTALDVKINEDKTVGSLLQSTAGLTKENIALRRFYRVRKALGQTFGTYTHNIGKIVSLVIINEKNQELADQLAMQVVANQAQYLSYDSIDQDTINYEKFMYEKNHGTFDQLGFDIYMESISLLNQKFYKNPKITVSKLLETNNIHIIDFYKFELGQGIDNKLNCRLDIPCDGSKITVMPVYKKK